MLQVYTMATVPCGNPTPKKLPTGVENGLLFAQCAHSARYASLQGVKKTVQPLGVGYANRPKKAQNGGVCGVFPYMSTSTNKNQG